MPVLTKNKTYSIDWKFPALICLSYISSCLIYEFLFTVPGHISPLAIICFSLAYIGIGFSLYLFKDKNLYFDSGKEEHLTNYHNPIFKITTGLVLIAFILQLITWLLIFKENQLFISFQQFFGTLRNSSVKLESSVPVWLSYPNGICFSAFCLAIANCRCQGNVRSKRLLLLSIINIFLNDLQTAARAGMVFVVFVLIILILWDWRVNHIKPIKLLFGVFGIAIFTQIPKILREGYTSINDLVNLLESIFRYSFAYLNTLSELLNRLPEPNWIGARSLLPIFNLISRLTGLIERSAIHSIEGSNIWGYNNYTITGEIIRDFSFVGCLAIPFLISSVILFFASKASRPLNIAISIYFCGWVVYGTITNILMLGGFLVSLVLLFSLVCIENIINTKNIRQTR